MTTERVRYYSSNDFCYGMGLEKIETMPIPDINTIGINDAIEYHEIFKYFKENVRKKTWSDEDFQKYKTKSVKLLELSKRYFDGLSEEKLVSDYCLIDNLYKTVFWELFDERKLYNRISEDAFERILGYENTPIIAILEREDIVKKYGKAISKYIAGHLTCARIIVRFYEQEYVEGRKIYLPNALSIEERLSLLDKYVDCEQANTNALKSIYLMRPKKKFQISDELRLKAKRRYDKEVEEGLKKGVVFSNGIKLSISKEQTAERKDTVGDNTISVSYSYDYLMYTTDYPSILNNFIYLFDYVDPIQMRCSHVCVEATGSTMEKVLASKATNVYPEYFAFRQINGLAMLQVHSYYHFLNEKGIRYEAVLQWFYTEYLQKEFGCSEMRVAFPSEHTSLLEKCVSMCTAFEMIIKQFSQYAQKHEIDFDLLNISTGAPKLDHIPSLVEKKYVYGKGDEYKLLDHLLFSDQCMLSCVSRVYENKKEHSCFFELIKNERIAAADYHENDKHYLKILAEEDLIKFGEDGGIDLGDAEKLTILLDLHYHEVISRWHYSEGFQPIFDSWIGKGLLAEESSLLSHQEADYFSYLLNQEKYINGLDIRNKYAHGNGQIIKDEEEHEKNYNILLRIMTILTIKINDDFCLYSALKKEEE